MTAIFLDKIELKGVEKGMKKGMEKGKIAGKWDLLWKQILARFPSANENYLEKIKELSSEKLDNLAIKLFEFNSYKDLDNYIISYGI